MKNSIVRALAPVFLSAVMLGCSDVTTDVVPTYDLTFWHETSTVTTDTLVLKNEVTGQNLAIPNYTLAGGQAAKAQTFSNEDVNKQFPEYVEVLLIDPTFINYSLGFGGDRYLRFRFKASGDDNITLQVVEDDTRFWINGDIFDRFDEFGTDEIHVQYLEKEYLTDGFGNLVRDSDGDLTLLSSDYWVATSGTVKLNSKLMVPSSSETGTFFVDVTFQDVRMLINGVPHVLNGRAIIDGNDNDSN